MANKSLRDPNGVIRKAYSILPEELYADFLKTLDELENNDCHTHHRYPHTETHKVKGIKQNVYRSYINKVSGWRIHFQFVDSYVELNDVLTREEHDDVVRVIKQRKGRYR